ncbi:MAG: HPr family phosphocarrier protein [Phycisphaerales bacterium]|nr:HPr family phosphocarrier protein [Phycisphaerales bacterium]
MSQTASITVTVPNRLGLHARPAMLFAERAQTHAADVRVRRSDTDELVDGKSIMHLMMLAATKGTELVIEASGTDAQAAVDDLESLVRGGFSEAD